MKNRTLILVIALMFSTSGILSAQTNKGKFLLGELSTIDLTFAGTPTSMTLGWSTYKSKSDSGNEDNSDRPKEFSINLTPKFGYFVINNLVVGLDISIGYNHANSHDGDIISKTTEFGVGPFLRYYIPTQKILPFAEVNYSIGSGNRSSEYFNENYEHKYQIQQYCFGVGMGIPLGEKVSFDTLVGYHSYIWKSKEDNEDNTRDIIITIGLKFGVTVLL